MATPVNGYKKTFWSCVGIILMAIFTQSYCLAKWTGVMETRMNAAEKRLERMDHRVYVLETKH